jgi:hypothetical protein
MNDEREFYLLSDVSRILGVVPHRIVYLLTTRKIPEPTMRLAGKRVFRRGDVERVATQLGVPLPVEFMSHDEVPHE